MSIRDIGTGQMGGVSGRLWPLYGDILDGLPRHCDVIAIRALHSETDWHAAAVGQHTALDANLPAIRGILVHLFHPRGVFG